jgi:hypothetical protein
MNDERPSNEVVVVPPIPVQSLEYAIPQERPVTPTHPVVGIAGLILYGILFVFFGLIELGMAVQIIMRHQLSHFMIVPVGIVTTLLGLSGWRAFAALYGTIRTMRKRKVM